ncbi:TPA: hypothetical protein ACH3X2_009353 [Trebouxia sp. C0005]
MLQVRHLRHVFPFTAISYTSASGAQFRGCFTPAMPGPAMDTLRQRKQVFYRVVTRSRTADNRTHNTDQAGDTTPLPANKRRKITPPKAKRRGLNDIAEEDDGAQSAQTSSSVDTSFTAVPAIASQPSGVPASTPADVPADPNVLHCWTKDSMAAAARLLAQRDAALAPIIEQHGVPDRLLAKGFTNMFNSLARSILSQQLAVKAASVIQGRFMALCQCEEFATPEAVLALDKEQLRGVGLSYAKAGYVLDLAKHFQSGQLSDEKIATMDDDTLVAELTKVKGIGRWTVDMFAMFHLGRPDVFPLGDLAVRKGLQELYKLKAKPSVAEFDAIGDVWRPHRSLGSYYMWRIPTSNQKSIKKKGVSTVAATADVTPAI